MTNEFERASALSMNLSRRSLSNSTPFKKIKDQIAIEEPLEIRVRGKAVAVTMRTPGHDHELAAGFLYTECLVRSLQEITGIAYCRQGYPQDPANIINVFVAPSLKLPSKSASRRFFSTSSCGVCGKSTIESIHQHFPPITTPPPLPHNILKHLGKKFSKAQIHFKKTGGLHAAALFDLKGNLLILREDVGRHNAVDKVVGYGFLHKQLPFEDTMLMVSGRASFEIMQKALSARVPIVVAISAPSSLAIDFARESRQTLVGFFRNHSYNLYTASVPTPQI